MSEVTAEMIERGRRGDPEDIARRRKMNIKLKHVRHALTSSTGDAAGPFDSMVRLFAESARSGAPAAALLTLGVGAAAQTWAPPILTLIWLAASLVMIGARYVLGAKYLGLANPESEAGLYRALFVLTQFLEGCAWACGVALLLSVKDPSAHGFTLVLLILIAGMIAMTASAIPAAVGAGLAPIVGAILWSVGARAPMDFALLAALCGGVLVYFIVLANRLLRSALAGFSFQEEKDALIAELEQAKLNSDEARRRAEGANLAKSRFLATMSHELRTPLNAILGFSEVMKAELFGPHASPSYKEYSTDIHSSGQHLLMLINEILDLSRVEAGRYDLKEEAVSLAGVVEECRHLLALRAKTKSIEVVEDIDEELPRLWADERALRQITLNILSNAIKFTPQGGRVTLKVARSEAQGQYLCIRDTGPGIPEAEIPVVLSSFGRGSMAQKNAEEGTGLGLPIVRGLVELHGGEFKLTSKVREGTQVTVTFPPERVMNALASLDPNAPSEAEIEAKRVERARRWRKRAPNAA
ncbi:MAG: sensor histidine kinase [Pseudomonadota bacterium]|nr:sensor histidine kinase [Pseudomonadota bacterium]